VVVTIFNAGGFAWAITKGLRDIKGVSMKATRIVKMLNGPEWSDTPEKKASAAALIIKD
jgi:hypothetical protein